MRFHYYRKTNEISCYNNIIILYFILSNEPKGDRPLDSINVLPITYWYARFGAYFITFTSFKFEYFFSTKNIIEFNVQKGRS